MQHIESITINAATSDVWPRIENPNRWEEWLEGVSDVHVDGELAVGSKISYRWRNREREMTVTRLIPSQELGVVGEVASYKLAEQITIRGLGKMTTVTMTMSFEPKAWWTTALMPVIFATKKFGMGSPMRKSLRALQQRVQAETEAVAA